MEPGLAASLPQRIWTVAIATRSGTSGAACGTCGPISSVGPALRSAALRHLALHALRDVTPPHLRVCQCGRRGCPWHGRHRGCAGPVLLTITCTPTAGTWRLADLCRQCAITTPHTIPVLHHTLPATADRPHPAAAPPADTDEDQPPVWEDSCPSCGMQECPCTDTCAPR
jgi:hypothetical protein